MEVISFSIVCAIALIALYGFAIIADKNVKLKRENDILQIKATVYKEVYQNHFKTKFPILKEEAGPNDTITGRYNWPANMDDVFEEKKRNLSDICPVDWIPPPPVKISGPHQNIDPHIYPLEPE